MAGRYLAPQFILVALGRTSGSATCLPHSFLEAGRAPKLLLSGVDFLKDRPGRYSSLTMREMSGPSSYICIHSDFS